MDLIADFFRNLHATTGWNFSIFHDPFDARRFWLAFWVTAQLAALSVVFSIVIGICGAFAQGLRFAPVRWLVNGYIAFFRNTPPLVQMYFFFFALGAITPMTRDDIGVETPLVSNFTWALIALSFFAGAFNVEIFRSGIEAIPRSTVEAAESLGYSRLKAYIYVILPLAFRVCMPSLNNNLVNLIKTTTLERVRLCKGLISPFLFIGSPRESWIAQRVHAGVRAGMFPLVGILPALKLCLTLPAWMP